MQILYLHKTPQLLICIHFYNKYVLCVNLYTLGQQTCYIN